MAEIKFLPHMGEVERIQILQEQASNIRNQVYNARLSEEEIENRTKLFYQNSIKIMDLEEEKKELIIDISEKIKEIKSSNKDLHYEIQSKSTKKNGVLYDMANYNTGFMETFDKNGELIEKRSLTPQEKQQTGNIFSKSKSS